MDGPVGAQAAVLVAVSRAEAGSEVPFPGHPQLAWDSPAFKGIVLGVAVVEACLWECAPALALP